MPQRLNRETVEDLAPAELEYTNWDTDARGLGIRVFPTGSKTWTYKYSLHDNQHRIKLGTWPSMTVATRSVGKRQLQPSSMAERSDGTNRLNHAAPRILRITNTTPPSVETGLPISIIIPGSA